MASLSPVARSREAQLNALNGVEEPVFPLQGEQPGSFGEVVGAVAAEVIVGPGDGGQVEDRRDAWVAGAGADIAAEDDTIEEDRLAALPVEFGRVHFPLQVGEAAPRPPMLA